MADLAALAALAAQFGGYIDNAPAPAAPAPGAAPAPTPQAPPQSAPAAPAAPAAPVDYAALAAQFGGTVEPYQVPQQEPGFFARLGEQITGTERATPLTEQLPDWATMPELNSASMASFKTGLGTVLTNPEETVQVIQANFPGVQLAKDEKGNFLLQSSIDGQWYAYKPGFKFSDIPRAAAGVLSFTPAGRATSIPGAIATNAATQAAIEASQAATGGEFNPADVAIAGAAGGAGQVIARGVKAAASKGAEMLRRGAAAAPDQIPGAPGAAAGQGATVAQAIPETAPAPSLASPADDFFQQQRAALAAQDEATAAAVQAQQQAAQEAAAGVAGQEAARLESVKALASDANQRAAADVVMLARKASGNGIGSAAARDRLADMAAVNLEAKAAADQLGIDLPFDVFSDSPTIRAAAGLTRSEVASPADAAWRNTISNAVDRADDLLKQYDAAFIEGAAAPGITAQKIKDSLIATRDDLAKQADAQFQEVNEFIKPETAITLPRLKGTLNKVTQEVTEGGLSRYEKKLKDMIQSGQMTYGRLIREKDIVGNAIETNSSAFSDMNTAALKRLYGAMAEDQLSNVAKIGGPGLRQTLRAANLLFTKKSALEKRLINLFGRDLEGSVADKMRIAITSAAKGDTGQFNRLFKTVPPQLQRETMATALASVVRASRGAEKGGFGFAEYARIYPKLRANPNVYDRIIGALGGASPEQKAAANQVLRDLFEVSKRVTDARAAVLTTGKANQVMRQAYSADSVIAAVLESAAGKGAMALASMVPGGGTLAQSMGNAVAKGEQKALEKAGDLFASEAFQDLVIAAATKPEVSAATLRKAAMDKTMTDFLKAARMPLELDKRVQWLQAAIQSGLNARTENDDQ